LLNNFYMLQEIRLMCRWRQKIFWM